MNSERDAVLIRRPDNLLASDFLIARYPVTRREFHALCGAGPAPEAPALLQRSRWADALRYCNALSAADGRPPAYCELSGRLLDRSGEPARTTAAVEGFRLPTLLEWEYAAKGWSGKKCGDYFPVQKAHYKVPLLDYPTSERQAQLFRLGYSGSDEMIPNLLGIYGMLVYGREWYSDFDEYDGIRNRLCYWEEYITNYDNDIGYMVRGRPVSDEDRYPFRVVITAPDSDRPVGGESAGSARSPLG